MKLPLLPLSILLSVTSLSFSKADVLWQENFQTQTPGAAPTGAVIQQSTGSKVTVVSSSTTVPDPFGGEGNQSLMLEKTAAGLDQIPRVTWELPSISTGAFSFDVYTPKGGDFNHPFMALFWTTGTLVTNTNTGVRFWAGENGVLTVGDGSSLRSVAGAWSFNETRHVEVELFNDSTYSISIDGDLVTWMDGSTAKTRFAFQEGTLSSSDLSHVQFSIASSSLVGSRFFINDLVMIPEPSTYLLLSGAIIVGVVLRYRKGKGLV